MPIFKQKDNVCYFIHIPRTGGRYVSSLFEKNKNVECFHHRINENRLRGVDETHLHYPLYNHFFGVNDIPHITIVRNPYDKFLSSIRNMNSIHKIDYNDFLLDESNFLEFVNFEIEISSFHNNWFLPQHKFISNKTFVWKFEDGFGENFSQWIFDKTKINLDNNENLSYSLFDGETLNKNYSLNSKIIDYVKSFYKKDYEKFNYEL